MNDSEHHIYFLSSQVPSGKSKVIKSVIKYCNSVYNALNIDFIISTIIVAFLTGTATISITSQILLLVYKLTKQDKKIDSDEIRAN